MKKGNSDAELNSCSVSTEPGPFGRARMAASEMLFESTTDLRGDL